VRRVVEPADLFDRFEPIDLETLDAKAALQKRVDNKYLVPADALDSLLERLRPDYRALEIDGRREALYESVYFDTGSLRCFDDHIKGRIPRAKVRTRLYVESGVCVFEAKVKLEDDETVKESLDYDAAHRDRITPEAREFLEQQLVRRRLELPLDALAATLTTRYRRATLGARASAERITFDGELLLSLSTGASARLQSDHLLVETKSETGESEADRVLREAGYEPASLSKYRAGIGLLVEGASPPDVQGWFTTTGPSRGAA
jgi:hypothetical protein